MQANPRKTTSIRPLGTVDIAALRAAVLAIPEQLWDAENADKPNRFEALDRTRHIVFRFVDDVRDWRGSHDRPMWREWCAMLLPVMLQATRAYGYRNADFPRVMRGSMRKQREDRIVELFHRFIVIKRLTSRIPGGKLRPSIETG